ncbi:MAG: chloride channel protein [Bacteroidia bacterium]
MLKYPLYVLFKNRSRYISNKNFLIIASIIVGTVSAFGGIALKYIIHFIESQLINKQFLQLQYQLLFYPVVGIIFSLVLIKYVFKTIPFEKGLTNIIYKVKYKQSKVEEVHTYAHLATSAVTVSLGGSVGVEAPIAITGSAIGSNIAKRLFVSPNDKALLLACGASAGISAIFNSPLAGVIFAFEVLLSSVSVSGFIPLLMASATAALINNFFYSGQLIVFNAMPWNTSDTPFFVVLGVFCGLISAYTIKTIYALENRFNNHQYKMNKAIIQGLILGVLILASPLLYGEGYYKSNIGREV